MVAGRPRTELESLVGFFVNTLILRQSFAGEPSFAQILAETRETFLDAQAHQEVPFEKLVEELRPERDTSRPPFVQVVFQVVGMELVPQLPGLASELIDRHSGTSKFDLTVSVHDPGRGELLLSVEYDSALFREAIRRAALRQLRDPAFRGDRRARKQRLAAAAGLGGGPARSCQGWQVDLPYDAAQTIPSLLARQMAATPSGSP